MRKSLLIFAVLMSFVSISQAATIAEKTWEIGRKVKCPVCSGQSIVDSDAPLALHMRKVIYDKLQAGEEESDIMTFLVKRYGEEVLFTPPLGIKTYLLWLTPFLLILIALGVLGVRYRKLIRRRA